VRNTQTDLAGSSSGEGDVELVMQRSGRDAGPAPTSGQSSHKTWSTCKAELGSLAKRQSDL